MTDTTPIFFYEEEIRPRASLWPYFLSRTAVTVPAPPLFFLLSKPPPQSLFEDPFVGVRSIVEAYSQATQILPQSLLALVPPKPRILEEEFEIRRTDHSLYFMVVRHYAAQMVGFETQIFDHWDDPWQEPMPRQRNHALDMQPFRQPPVIIIGQPWLLFYGQPKPPYVEAEVDPIHRGDYRGLTYIVANPPLPPVVIMRVQAVGIGTYDYARIQTALGVTPVADPILYGPGDVFDILAQDFSDSSINYTGAFAGQPFYGWMKQVPPTTPLSHPDIALYDFPSMRRLVF